MLKNVELGIRILKCQSYTTPDDHNDKCPIFVPLRKHLPDFEKDCPKYFQVHSSDQDNHSVFWSTIRNGFVRYHQAAYFEILFIQFFIISLLNQSPLIHLLSIVSACVIFLFPYLLLTYFEQEPLPLFENKNMRLALAFFLWLFVIGLFSIQV